MSVGWEGLELIGVRVSERRVRKRGEQKRREEMRVVSVGVRC